MSRCARREANLNLDWRRLKAVVLESDDWGLCAWSPDAQAWRVLTSLPAFRTAAGRRYGGSTLESADDVRQLLGVLAEFRGGDGFSPVWQANSVMAGPAFERLKPPQFEFDELPLAEPERASSRWQRPGLRDTIDAAVASGMWWPELHGLHHVPEQAWLTALRRGIDDARRALEQHSLVCVAVEASGEYAPSEPRELRRRNLARAVERFRDRFGRPPGSLCPPDYRWDEALEADAEALGVTTLQGLAEQAGHRFARLRRASLHHRWPLRRGGRFYLPPRIAFEPCAWTPAAQDGPLETARRAVQDAWGRGQPAIVSSHRLNYAHLEPARAAAGRAALRRLLSRLAGDGAIFLTDAEVRHLDERGWSLRQAGPGGAILRCYGVSGEPVRFATPLGMSGAAIREGAGTRDARLDVEGGDVVARVGAGEYWIDWRR